MKKVVLITALLGLAALTAFASDTVVEEIVVRVNNAIITRSEVDRSRGQVENELRENNIPATDKRAIEARKNVLRDLIDQELLVQKAGELGINADTELVKRLDEIRKQLKLTSMEDLEKAAQQQGVSYEEFKNNLRKQILTQQVISQEVGSKIQITQEEMKAYYGSHQQDFDRPEEVRLSEILISTEKQGGEAGSDPVAAAQAKAEEVLAKIKGGGDFAGLATQYSGGPTASTGGDLGYFKRGSLAAELENEVFAMKAGEVTGITRTKQGFLILKVTEHRAAGVIPLKEAEPQIQQTLYQKELEPNLRKYLTKLREEAYIDMKPGYLDTGASPNQTKPIMVSTPMPQTADAKNGKKNDGLKRKKKLGIF